MRRAERVVHDAWARGARLLVAVILATLILAWAGGDALVEEDGPVENLTALVLAGVVIVSVVCAVRSVPGTGRDTVGLIAMIAALVLLDELSFGQRILGWSMPELAGVRVDSLHDAVSVAYEWLAQMGARRIHYLVLVAAGCLSLIGAVATRPALARAVARHLAERPAIGWLAVALALGVIATILDLKGNLPGVRALEESLELGAAIGLALAARAGAQAAGFGVARSGLDGRPIGSQ